VKTYTYWLHFRDTDGATVDILPLHTASRVLSFAPLRAAQLFLERAEDAEWCDVYSDPAPGKPRPLLAAVWKPGRPGGITRIDTHITQEGYNV
jgi:hypothetical protein